MRQHTFLSDPAWQEVPWQNHPKTLYDQLYDVLLLAPALLRQGDMLAHMDGQSQLQLARDMISKCWKLDQVLDTLYDKLDKNHEGPLYWPQLACDERLNTQSEDGRLFPVAFHFPNLSLANTVLLYWSLQAMLWDGMCQLYRVMHELQVKFAASTASGPGMNLDWNVFSLRPLGHRVDFASSALNVFQSVEYCLSDEMHDQGPKSVAVPLRISMETLRKYPQYKQEVDWADSAMTQVQGRSLRLLIYYTGSKRG